ncbi:MAG: GGDEF domain-containing protein [Actinomycetaceae bacterium]
MSLDTFTLQAIAGLIVLTVTILFVVDARTRGEDDVDRIWGGAFAAALTGSFAFVVAASSPQLWWANGYGNGAVVLTTFLMWNGTRAWTGRRPLLAVSAGAGSLAVLATLAEGPDGGAWAGGWAMLLGASVGGILAGTELLRARRRRSPVVVLLAAVVLAAGAFYLLRFVLILTAGPDSHVFRRWAGTAASSIVIIALITCAAFCMIAMRGQDIRAERREQRNYDPMTGARTVLSFRPRAQSAIVGDRATHQPVSMVTLDLDDHERIATAFDRSVADDAVITVGEVVRRLLPPRSLIGREDSRTGFDVLLSRHSVAEARLWAEQVRTELLDAPLAVETGRLRLRMSIGIACDETAGYDLDDLAQVCRDAASAALGEGGNRVHVATVEEGAASLASVGRRIGAPRERASRPPQAGAERS